MAKLILLALATVIGYFVFGKRGISKDDVLAAVQTGDPRVVRYLAEKARKLDMPVLAKQLDEIAVKLEQGIPVTAPPTDAPPPVEPGEVAPPPARPPVVVPVEAPPGAPPIVSPTTGNPVPPASTVATSGGTVVLPTLRLGMTGDPVKRWQTAIGVTVDGRFGTETESATKLWQARRGLAADGIVGPKTWNALATGAPITNPEASPPVAVRPAPPPVPPSVHNESFDWRAWYNSQDASMQNSFDAAKSAIKTAASNLLTFQGGPLYKALTFWYAEVAPTTPPSTPVVSPVTGQSVPSTVNVRTSGGVVPLPTIKRGSTGDTVKKWQAVIGAKPDGIFGPNTEAATKAYQQKNGLAADGIVGPKTWAIALKG